MNENKELEFILNACLNDALCVSGINNTNKVANFITEWMRKNVDKINIHHPIDKRTKIV